MSLNIGSDVSVLDGGSLNLELRMLQNEIETIKRRQGARVFTSWEQLGLTNKASREEVAKRMPLNTIFIVEALSKDSGESFPLPHFTWPTKNYMSGQLTVVKANDHAKVQFTWRNESYTCECSLNTYVSSNVTPWRFINRGTFTGQLASQYNNLVSNIWVPGTYYFTRGEFTKFIDKASDNGGWLTVYNPDNTPGSNCMYVFSENNPSARTWKKNGTSAWSTTPNFFPNGAGDSEMLVGDFKIAGGALYVKIKSNSVVEVKAAQ